MKQKYAIRAVNINTGDIKYFNSVKICAKDLQMSPYTIKMCYPKLCTFKGWYFESAKTPYKPIAEELEERYKPARPVMAHLPSGQLVKFNNCIHAANLLGVNVAALYKAMNNKTQYGNWIWEEYINNMNIIEPTEDILKSFQKKERKKNNNIARTKQVKEPELKSKKWKRIGYYDMEFGPIVCPICGKILTTPKPTHLSKCLKGHTYNIEFGLIKVYD